MSASESSDSGSSDESNKLILHSVQGDAYAFHVFTEAFCRGLRIIFRFSINTALRRSIQSRVVTCFHGKPVLHVTETFADKNMMQNTIRVYIDRVWDSCSNHPSITTSDVVVEMYEDADGHLQWSLSHLSSYNDYLKQLLRLDQVLEDETWLDRLETLSTVDVSSLTYYGGIGGRGDNKLVRLNPDPDSPLYVFRGLDFAKYLFAGSTFHFWKNDIYNEIRTIRSLRPHPNIVLPATIFVTAAHISKEPKQNLVCGTLYLYLENGNVNEQVRRAKVAKPHLSLDEKAKWCFQMVSAIAHTHGFSKTYHNDVKPSNFLVNDARNLVLINWKQGGATRSTRAPEADGSYDVCYDVETRPDTLRAKRLLYSKYEGPKRTNHPSSWPHWNVFPTWRNLWPEAVQAAEVFSLGRTMWMLLDEVDQGSPRADSVVAYWSLWSRAIPAEWQAVVERCLEFNPEKRIKLSDLLSFWEAAQK